MDGENYILQIIIVLLLLNLEELGMLSNKLMGRNFFGILNDLKRDFSTAACELGIDTSLLQRYIDGREEIPHELIVKASQIWPVNIRDFYVFEDDALTISSCGISSLPSI